MKIALLRVFGSVSTNALNMSVRVICIFYFSFWASRVLPGSN